ncbi:acid protease, partial [Athelia psychrophila]
TLLIDSGSSVTWVGAATKYVHTSTAKKTGGHVTVNYGSGSFSGYAYNDTVTVAPGFTVTNMTIASATKTAGFKGVDGILGIGPVFLTLGSDSTQGLLPTITDNLFAQGHIPANEIGIFFKPAQSSGGAGELTWGGVDKTQVTGSVNYVPITPTNPASNYWGIDQSLTYGNTTIFEKASGIVDTGTTLILLATNHFVKYQQSLGVGAVSVDKATGLIKLSAAQYAKLKPLNFKIGQHTYTLSPNAQIFPRSLTESIGGVKGSIYLVVGDMGASSGQGMDFINGYAFLERFYSVYDTANKRVGFAETAYTNANTN